jgi:hypothetical protein
MTLAELRHDRLDSIANWLDTTNELVNQAEVRAILANLLAHVIRLEEQARRDALARSSEAN